MSLYFFFLTLLICWQKIYRYFFKDQKKSREASVVNEFQAELISQLEKFRKDQIEPTAEADDHAELFRMDVFRQLGELGFTGMTTPEDFGGVGLGYQDLCAALMELAKSSVSYAVTVSVSSMVQAIINEYGSDDQKIKYLPTLASGEVIGAFALTESSAGSDAASLLTTAKKTAKGYL